MVQYWDLSEGNKQCIQGVARKVRIWIMRCWILDKQVGKGVESRCLKCRRLNEMTDHLSQCKNKSTMTVVLDQIVLKEQCIEGTYAYPDLQKWLIAYFRNQNIRRF